MSRNGSGVYSLPAIYEATTGETIEATQHNSPLKDLEQDMNTARPVVAGGTGAVTASAARANLGVDAAVTYTTKSANYTLLAADKAKAVRFSGTFTAALTAAATLDAGWYAWIIADGGAVTIDPNGSETINGASTLVLSDGEMAFVVCSGTTFFAAVGATIRPAADNTFTGVNTFTKRQNWAKGADLGDTDIDASGILTPGNDGNYFHLGGTETLKGIISLTAGAELTLVCTSSRTVTHNATSFILIGGADIAAVAGDVLTFASEGSGNWRQVVPMPTEIPPLGPVAVIEDQKASSVDAGTFTSGAWQTRDLNTIVFDPDSHVTVSSNQLTFDADGVVEFCAPAYRTGGHQARLYNVTDGVAVGVGQSATAGSSFPVQTISIGLCEVQAGKLYELQHYGHTTLANTGLGIHSPSPAVNVYSRIKYWKI